MSIDAMAEYAIRDDERRKLAETLREASSLICGASSNKEAVVALIALTIEMPRRAPVEEWAGGQQ